MNDHELDELLARAAVVTDPDIAEWARTVPYNELCEEIMSTTATPNNLRRIDTGTGVPVGAGGPPRRARHRLRRVAAMAAAALVIVGLGAIVNLRGDDEPSTGVWAAELVEFAQRSPLMLIDDPAWTVAYADEYDNGGEVSFTKTSTEAALYWRPRPLSEWLEDRLSSGTDRGSHDVVNGTAAIVQYDDSDHYTALWDSDGNVLEFRAQASSLDEFRSLLDSLVVVDVDTWLNAMPASVVGAADQEAVITEMLNGIPLPGDFNPDTLADGAQIKDRYQLGARVVGAVSCAWIAQWIDATENGDTGASQEAVDAMNTSTQWPVLQEMNRSGAFGEVIQEFAEAMTNGGQIMQGTSTNIADSRHDALGCAE